MVKSIGGKRLVRCTEVVRFSEGPLLEVLLYVWSCVCVYMWAGVGFVYVLWLQYCTCILEIHAHLWHVLCTQQTPLRVQVLAQFKCTAVAAAQDHTVMLTER